MSNRASESIIFRSFLELNPEFAGEPLREWSSVQQDPPDIACTTNSGLRVAIELGEWLNESQMAQAMVRKAIQESVLDAIGPQPENNFENIYYAQMETRPRLRVKPTEAGSFRTEILALAQDMDRRWSREPNAFSPQGVFLTDMPNYPTVARYIRSLNFYPRRHYPGWPPDGRILTRKWPAGLDWLVFAGSGGAYSERSTLSALRSILAKKIAKYADKPLGSDEFHLLIHYNQAVLYNTPLETHSFSFEDAVRDASAFIGDDAGVFDKIFLQLAFEPGARVFRIYPITASAPV